jgi:ParB-like chromosome segregation protein Spo0J
MRQPAEVTLEVSHDELGDRLSDVRLVPASDPAMEGSLRRYGQLSPLVVFRDQRQRLEVIDGFRRLRVAAQQGHPQRLQVRVLELDETRALSALFALHRGGTALTELEEAWVVQALVREHRMAQTSVAQLLRRHQSWVSRRLLLVEALAPEVQMDVRLGLVSPTAAREVARLPRGIQQMVARTIAQHGMSTRATAKLVAAAERLKPTTAEEIERLCRSAQGEAPSRAGPGTDAEAYAADLRVLERVACRLHARLCDRPPGQLPPPCDQEVRSDLRAAIAALRSLLETMSKTVEGPS